MVFQSNPGFVFHDSCGFEAGDESEFEKVKAFIAGRSKEVKLKNQLHAIWYLQLPIDRDLLYLTVSSQVLHPNGRGKQVVHQMGNQIFLSVRHWKQ
jgi:hypothetical protein